MGYGRLGLADSLRPSPCWRSGNGLVDAAEAHVRGALSHIKGLTLAL